MCVQGLGMELLQGEVLSPNRVLNATFCKRSPPGPREESGCIGKIVGGKL